MMMVLATGGAVSANWAALKAAMGPSRKRRGAPGAPGQAEPSEAQHKRPQQLGDTEGLTPVLALDCEMVGVGPQGARSSLARCALPSSGGLKRS